MFCLLATCLPHLHCNRLVTLGEVSTPPGLLYVLLPAVLEGLLPQKDALRQAYKIPVQVLPVHVLPVHVVDEFSQHTVTWCNSAAADPVHGHSC